MSFVTQALSVVRASLLSAATNECGGRRDLRLCERPPTGVEAEEVTVVTPRRRRAPADVSSAASAATTVLDTSRACEVLLLPPRQRRETTHLGHIEGTPAESSSAAGRRRRRDDDLSDLHHYWTEILAARCAARVELRAGFTDGGVASGRKSATRMRKRRSCEFFGGIGGSTDAPPMEGRVADASSSEGWGMTLAAQDVGGGNMSDRIEVEERVRGLCERLVPGPSGGGHGHGRDPPSADAEKMDSMCFTYPSSSLSNVTREKMMWLLLLISDDDSMVPSIDDRGSYGCDDASCDKLCTVNFSSRQCSSVPAEFGSFDPLASSSGLFGSVRGTSQRKRVATGTEEGPVHQRSEKAATNRRDLFGCLVIPRGRHDRRYNDLHLNLATPKVRLCRVNKASSLHQASFDPRKAKRTDVEDPLASHLRHCKEAVEDIKLQSRDAHFRTHVLSKPLAVHRGKASEQRESLTQSGPPPQDRLNRKNSNPNLPRWDARCAEARSPCGRSSPSCYAMSRLPFEPPSAHESADVLDSVLSSQLEELNSIPVMDETDVVGCCLLAMIGCPSSIFEVISTDLDSFSAGDGGKAGLRRQDNVTWGTRMELKSVRPGRLPPCRLRGSDGRCITSLLKLFAHSGTDYLRVVGWCDSLERRVFRPWSNLDDKDSSNAVCGQRVAISAVVRRQIDRYCSSVLSMQQALITGSGIGRFDCNFGDNTTPSSILPLSLLELVNHSGYLRTEVAIISRLCYRHDNLSQSLDGDRPASNFLDEILAQCNTSELTETYLGGNVPTNPPLADAGGKAISSRCDLLNDLFVKAMQPTLRAVSRWIFYGHAAPQESQLHNKILSVSTASASEVLARVTYLCNPLCDFNGVTDREVELLQDSLPTYCHMLATPIYRAGCMLNLLRISDLSFYYKLCFSSAEETKAPMSLDIVLLPSEIKQMEERFQDFWDHRLALMHEMFGHGAEAWNGSWNKQRTQVADRVKTERTTDMSLEEQKRKPDETMAATNCTKAGFSCNGKQVSTRKPSETTQATFEEGSRSSYLKSTDQSVHVITQNSKMAEYAFIQKYEESGAEHRESAARWRQGQVHRLPKATVELAEQNEYAKALLLPELQGADEKSSAFEVQDRLSSTKTTGPQTESSNEENIEKDGAHPPEPNLQADGKPNHCCETGADDSCFSSCEKSNSSRNPDTDKKNDDSFGPPSPSFEDEPRKMDMSDGFPGKSTCLRQSDFRQPGREKEAPAYFGCTAPSDGEGCSFMKKEDSNSFQNERNGAVLSAAYGRHSILYPNESSMTWWMKHLEHELENQSQKYPATIGPCWNGAIHRCAHATTQANNANEKSLPMETALHACFFRPIVRQCVVAEQLVIAHILCKAHLTSHIALLRHFMLGLGGYLRSFAVKVLFLSKLRFISSNPTVDADSFTTSNVIEVHQSSLQLSGFTGKEWLSACFSYTAPICQDRHGISSAESTVSSSRLGTHMPFAAKTSFPASVRLIIDDVAVHKYNVLQKFLIQHISVEYMMNEMWRTLCTANCRLQCEGSSSKTHQMVFFRLNLFRHELHTVIGTLSRYFCGKFDASWRNMQQMLNFRQNGAKENSFNIPKIVRLDHLHSLHMSDLDWLLRATFQGEDQTNRHIRSYIEAVYCVACDTFMDVHDAKKSTYSIFSSSKVLLSRLKDFRSLMNDFRDCLRNATIEKETQQDKLHFHELHEAMEDVTMIEI